MISQILAPEARARLANLRTVKPERARAVEDLVLNAARSGRLKAVIQENDFIQLLTQISSNEDKATAQNFTVSILN